MTKKDTATLVNPEDATASATNYVVNHSNGASQQASIHPSTPMPDVWSRHGSLALLRLLAVAVDGLVRCP